MKRIKLDEKKLFLASVFVLYFAALVYFWVDGSPAKAFLRGAIGAAVALGGVLFVRKNGLRWTRFWERPKLILGLLTLLFCVIGAVEGNFLATPKPWLGICMSVVYCLALYGLRGQGAKGLWTCMLLVMVAVAFQTNFVFRPGATSFLIVVLATTLLAIRRDWFSQKERANQLIILALGLVLAVFLSIAIALLMGGILELLSIQFFVGEGSAQSVSVGKILSESALVGPGNPAVLADEILAAHLQRWAGPLLVITYYLGWAPAILVMALFCVLIFSGFRLAFKRQCPNGFLLLTGVTLLTVNLLFMLLTGLGLGSFAYEVPFFESPGGLLIPALLLAGYCRLDLPVFLAPAEEQAMLTVVQGPAGSGKTQYMKAMLHQWRPYGAYMSSEMLYDSMIGELKETGEISGQKPWEELFPELEEKSIQILAIDDVDMQFQAREATQRLLAEAVGRFVKELHIHVMVAGVDVEKNLPRFLEQLKAMGIECNWVPPKE